MFCSVNFIGPDQRMLQLCFHKYFRTFALMNNDLENETGLRYMHNELGVINSVNQRNSLIHNVRNSQVRQLDKRFASFTGHMPALTLHGIVKSVFMS